MTLTLFGKRARLQFTWSVASTLLAVAGLLLCANGCGKETTVSAPPAPAPESQVQVSASASGVLVNSPAAEFAIAPNGYVAASLVSNGRKLSLDDAAGGSGVAVIAGAKNLPDVVFDVAHPKISAPHGQLGTRGKRIELTGKNSAADLEETLVVEVYDEFPSVALVSVSIRNSGKNELKLDSVDVDRHRFNASLADPAVAPNDMWSFYGSSIEWGRENVFEVPKKFSQENQMGSVVEVKGDLGRVGGGIPVVAFWTKTVGEAIGHVELLPLVLSIPVETQSDERVGGSVRIAPETHLGPGEVYSSPRTFLAVYSGDYYEPLRMYS